MTTFGWIINVLMIKLSIKNSKILLVRLKFIDEAPTPALARTMETVVDDSNEEEKKEYVV